jgi:hypothetical protein
VIEIIECDLTVRPRGVMGLFQTIPSDSVPAAGERANDVFLHIFYQMKSNGYEYSMNGGLSLRSA